ncbi:putative C6 transcription factor [Aspergillus bombycis]|uniref:Putative C6 transcription factor n=1 Tax=Aspergillus bombycis TaxID=109264 RepID=A0A1F7ZWG2_9EURO|nr:putative C6 transcription factor [Aspergillus bombycis]OGM43790.1 putative C6 transcription factor [Aspergillus bombycis]
MRPSVLPRHLSRRINPSSLSRNLATPSQYLQRPTIPSSTLPTTRKPYLANIETLRSFHLPSISSLLSNNGNGNNNGRTLTATRTLPYAPESLYKVISSVESYSQFLPFLTASTVTHRDPETGYPSRAFLTVGYGPLSETFTSRVDCDRTRWIVEARSGAKFGIDSKDGQAGGNFPGANEGIFEYLSTKWELVPVQSDKPMTKVDLEIQFEFRNQLHAAMMSAVEGQMAGIMIEAFEKRIRDIEGRR